MSHWLWNESPTINTDFDIEFFSDVEDETGTLEVPFAVLRVYTEACGGGGGGGASNSSPKFYPNDAASGGGGGAWCYKTWDVGVGGSFDYSVGRGGEGGQYSGGGCSGGERGTDGGNSRVTYTIGGTSSFMEAGGGESGGLTQEAFGGVFTGADGGRNGGDTKKVISSGADARGGRGGGAGGQGAGSRTEGKFTVNFTIYERECFGAGDGEVCYDNYYNFTEDLTAKICGGPSGAGVGVGGNLLNAGIDSNTDENGYYRIRGKNGSLYGGGGGGSSGGHCKTNYTDYDDRADINGGWTANGISPTGFSGLFVTSITLSNTRKGGDGGDGARGFIYLAATYEPPEITYLEMPTNENLDASPTQELTISYITNYAHEVRLVDSSGREMFKITNLDENGHPQKVADGTKTFTADHLRSAVENGVSPACDIFTFYAKGPGGEVSQTIQGCIYNDDCIRDIVIPNQGPFDPNEPVELNITVQDIDMPTVVQSSQGLTFSKDGGSTNTSSDTVLNGDTLTLKTESLPFCKDERGLEHHRKLYIEFGTGDGACDVKRVEFTVITRRPETKEIFDLVDNKLALPYPKIDTTNVNPTEYLQNNNGPTLIDEVELSDPYGVQIRVKDMAKSKPYTDRETWYDVSAENGTNSEVRVNRSSSGLQDWKEPNIIGVNEIPPASGPAVVEPNVTYTDPPPPVPPD